MHGPFELGSIFFFQANVIVYFRSPQTQRILRIGNRKRLYSVLWGVWADRHPELSKNTGEGDLIINIKRQSLLLVHGSALSLLLHHVSRKPCLFLWFIHWVPQGMLEILSTSDNVGSKPDPWTYWRDKTSETQFLIANREKAIHGGQHIRHQTIPLWICLTTITLTCIPKKPSIREERNSHWFRQRLKRLYGIHHDRMAYCA